MKYYPRLKMYKASNVQFDPETISAYSYDWWQFVRSFNGTVVFNDYNYSSMTVKHQWKVRSVLDDLCIKIDLSIECPGGLQDLESGVRHYEKMIADLQELIKKPGTHRAKNAQRKKLIAGYRKKISIIQKTLMDKSYGCTECGASYDNPDTAEECCMHDDDDYDDEIEDDDHHVQALKEKCSNENREYPSLRLVVSQ